MKRTKYFFAAALAVAMVCVSCDKKDKNTPVIKPDTDSTEVVVPEVEEPAEGIVKFVVKIPTGSECKGVAIKGTYDGSAWSGKDTYLGADQNAQAAPDSCITFKQLEGDWYTAEYAVLKDGYVNGDVTLFLAGKVCLIYSGDDSWEGQASSWDYIDAGSAVTSKSGDGNLQIESSTGVVYIEVKEWQASECVCVANEDYVITVESSIDFWIVGDMNNWTPTKMENNTLSGSFAPGTKFKFASHDGSAGDWWSPEVAVDVNYNAETNCYSTNDIVLKSGVNKVNVKIEGIIGEGDLVKCE